MISLTVVAGSTEPYLLKSTCISNGDEAFNTCSKHLKGKEYDIFPLSKRVEDYFKCSGSITREGYTCNGLKPDFNNEKCNRVCNFDYDIPDEEINADKYSYCLSPDSS
jgi:hypothetical protein